MPLKSKKAGFSLIEIMIVVLIIGVLAAIVTPYYIRARDEAQSKACIANLRELEGAKERWAISLEAGLDEEPLWTELIPDFLKTPARCPANGTYTIGDCNTTPTCSVGTNDTEQLYDDHVLRH